MANDLSSTEFEYAQPDRSSASRRSIDRIPREITMWRRLRRGMSTSEVFDIFGSPDARTTTDREETWHYVSGPSIMDLTLSFQSGLLVLWTEPDRSLYMPATRPPDLQPA